MHFEDAPKVKDLLKKLSTFMGEHVYANERTHDEQVKQEHWRPVPIVEALKARAKAARLWNLFLPHSDDGAELTNLEYAPLCEVMGASRGRRRCSTARPPTPATWKC